MVMILTECAKLGENRAALPAPIRYMAAIEAVYYKRLYADPCYWFISIETKGQYNTQAAALGWRENDGLFMYDENSSCIINRDERRLR